MPDKEANEAFLVFAVPAIVPKTGHHGDALTLGVSGLAMNFPEDTTVADQYGGQRCTVQCQEAEEVVRLFVPRRWKEPESDTLVESGHRRMLHDSEDDRLRSHAEEWV